MEIGVFFNRFYQNVVSSPNFVRVIFKLVKDDRCFGFGVMKRIGISPCRFSKKELTSHDIEGVNLTGVTEEIFFKNFSSYSKETIDEFTVVFTQISRSFRCFSKECAECGFPLSIIEQQQVYDKIQEVTHRFLDMSHKKSFSCEESNSEISTSECKKESVEQVVKTIKMAFCKDDSNLCNLTENKMYKIIENDSDINFVCFIDDEGKKRKFNRNRFWIVDVEEECV